MSHPTATARPAPQPFLRWAGGKRKLAQTLVSMFPSDYDGSVNRYFEPFLGGGALALALGDPESLAHVMGRNLYLNDVNTDLVLAYIAVRDDPHGLMAALDRMARHLDAEEYAKVRAMEPRSEMQRAARFVYLNKTCFNGLWRVNAAGRFNVPYGNLKNPKIYERDNLLAVSSRLQGAKLTSLPFSAAVEPAKPGDLVYFDPPYIPLTPTSSFAQYAKDGFGLLDQYALAGVIAGLSARGVRVILSNSHTPETRAIFEPVLNLTSIRVARNISAKAASRGSVAEVIGTNFT